MRVNEGNAKREIYNYKCLYLKRFQINKLFILRNLKSIKPNPKYQKEGTNSKAETKVKKQFSNTGAGLSDLSITVINIELPQHLDKMILRVF